MLGCLPNTANFLHPPVCGKARFLHSEYSFQESDTEDPELTDPVTGIVNKLIRNYVFLRLFQTRNTLLV